MSKENVNMEYLDKYDFLINVLTEEVEIDGKRVRLKDDFEKFFIKGNKTVVTRVRKFMEILRRAAEDIRNDVQDYKKNL
jgi:glutathione peroxidase-family protein